MLTGERINSGQTGRDTMFTTVATGKPQIVDVDEWLYRANRVRAFTPDSVDYVPRHRAEATVF